MSVSSFISMFNFCLDDLSSGYKSPTISALESIRDLKYSVVSFANLVALVFEERMLIRNSMSSW